MFDYVPLGDARLDQFQQRIALAFARLEAVPQTASAVPGLVLVASQPFASTAISFAGLTGDSADTQGYVIMFRGRGAGNLGVQFNGDATVVNYRYAQLRVSNGGAAVTGAGSDAATAVIVTGSVTSSTFANGTITVPYAHSHATSYARAVTAQCEWDESSTSRGGWTIGSYIGTAEITSIQIYNAVAFTEGQVSLYRTVR